jgi:hypothetical protein
MYSMFFVYSVGDVMADHDLSERNVNHEVESALRDGCQLADHFMGQDRNWDGKEITYAVQRGEDTPKSYPELLVFVKN